VFHRHSPPVNKKDLVIASNVHKKAIPNKPKFLFFKPTTTSMSPNTLKNVKTEVNPTEKVKNQPITIITKKIFTHQASGFVLEI